MDPFHFFQPVAMESSGTFGPKTFAFLKELGHRDRRAAEEKRPLPFLIQPIAVKLLFRGESVPAWWVHWVVTSTQTNFLLVYLILLFLNWNLSVINWIYIIKQHKYTYLTSPLNVFHFYTSRKAFSSIYSMFAHQQKHPLWVAERINFLSKPFHTYLQS